MSRSSCSDRDNGRTLVFKPFVQSAVGFRHASGENMHRHCQAHAAHRDIHSAIPDGVVRHVLNECRKASSSHSLSPRLNSTERFGIGGETGAVRNTVTWVKPLIRRTAVSLRRAASETSRMGTAA